MTALLCACCRKPRKRRADNRGWTGYRNYCPACAERGRLAGWPPDGPPAASSGTGKAARISAGLRAYHATHGQSEAARAALLAAAPVAPAAWRRVLAQGKTNRVQDYAWLVSFGEPREAAAARVGVTGRHARYVYEPLLAAREAA